MAFYIGQKSYLSAIRVFNDSLEISRVNNISVLREQATPKDIVQYADSLKGGQVWFSDFMAYRYTTGGRYVVSMLRNVNSLNNPAVKLGTLRIDIDERALAQLFVSEVKTYGGQVYLVDSAGKILSASDSAALQTFHRRRHSGGIHRARRGWRPAARNWSAPFRSRAATGASSA